MSIEPLLSVLSPPSAALEVPSDEEWRETQGRLTRLPSDYRDFLRIYGSGSVDNFIWIFNPSSGNENLNLCRQVADQLDVLHELKATGELVPFPLFPDAGGLLPFGVSDNGDVLLWKTKGDPCDWTVVVSEARCPNYEEYSQSMSDFLASVLAGKTVSAIFPDDFPSKHPRFAPMR